MAAESLTKMFALLLRIANRCYVDRRADISLIYGETERGTRWKWMLHQKFEMECEQAMANGTSLTLRAMQIT